jgi:uncharacterized cupin superfamily protein
VPREKLALGDVFGLTKIGVNLTTLAPGKVSSMRHWHSHEDELVYVVEGEVVLITDDGEYTLRAGMCAGFPAGDARGHHFMNRTKSAARFFEISNRDDADQVEYTAPDVDMAYRGGALMRRDGSPID